MKKISKATGDIRFSGSAGINSIFFSANKINGSLSLFRNSVVSHINEEGEIICADEMSYMKEKQSTYNRIGAVGKKYEKIFKNASIIMFALSIIIAFTNSYLTNVISSLFLFIWACYLSSGTICLFIEKLKKNNNIYGILKFHSAEHAVINAYHDLGRIPTLEEIRDYSNYSYNCGSLTEIKKFITMFTFALVRLIPNPMLSLILMPMILILFIFIPEEIFFFMQFLVTAEPTDREYKVAIKGLDYAVQGLQTMETKIDYSYVEEIRMFVGALLGKHEFSEDECQDCSNYKMCKKMFGNR